MPRRSLASLWHSAQKRRKYGHHRNAHHVGIAVRVRDRHGRTSHRVPFGRVRSNNPNLHSGRLVRLSENYLFDSASRIQRAWHNHRKWKWAKAQRILAGRR